MNQENKLKPISGSVFMVAAALSLYAMSAAADTYVLDSALSGRDDIDWTVASSYSGTYSRDPAANDTVEIPASMVAKVTAGSASWTLINTLARIVPKDGAVFEIDVSSSYEGTALLDIPVTEFGLSGASNSGTLRKIGSGALELTSYGKVTDGQTICDYNLNIAVAGGNLHLYRVSTSNTGNFRFQNIDVAASATLHICNVGWTYCANLDGTGFVTLDNVSNQQRIVLFGSGTSSYDGWMTGKIRVDIQSGRHDITCKTNTIDTICLSGTGVCGFTRLGANNNVPSTLGIGNFNFGSSSGIIYIGDEAESSAKTFWFGVNSFIDAGIYGGLTLSGQLNSSGSSLLRVLTLCGSNDNVCSISGTFPGKDDQRNVFYLCKKGTGTWRMAHNNSRGSLGVIDVENGTLQFDSIAEKGSPCSLGYATNLFAKVTDVAYENGTPVGYAMVLGGDGTEGTLEYMGASAMGCSSRPIAVRNKGRLKATGAPFAISGVYALGADEKILTLDGSAEGVSAVSSISNGTTGAKLSVVKDGSGTWELHGTNTFTGALFARGGVMRVRNWGTGTRFRWYRICITENIYGSSRYTANKTDADNYEKEKIQVAELGLYDSNGVNLLAGFTTSEPDSILKYPFDGDYSSLPVGEAALGVEVTSWSFNQTDGQLYNLFDGTWHNVNGGLGVSDGGIFLDKQSTWLPIVVRLPDDAGEAVRIDFLSALASSHTYNGRCITAYRLDGSVDGIHWEVGIAQDDALVPPATGTRWYSDPDTTATYGTRPNKGFALDQTAHIKNDSYAFSAIGTANGAVLEVLGEPLTVTGLVVSVSESAGIISNVVFEASGTVDVRNAEIPDGMPLDLPGDYSNLSGVENLARWGVTLDGVPYTRRRIVVKNGRLSLVPKGLRISFR